MGCRRDTAISAVVYVKVHVDQMSTRSSGILLQLLELDTRLGRFPDTRVPAATSLLSL